PRVYVTQKLVECVAVGSRQGCQWVQRSEDLLFLLLGPGADQYRHFAVAFKELLAGVTINQTLGPLVVEQGTRTADLTDGVPNSVQLLLRVRSPVVRILAQRGGVDPGKGKRSAVLSFFRWHPCHNLIPSRQAS